MAPHIAQLDELHKQVEGLMDEFDLEQSRRMWELEKKKAPVLQKRKEAIAKIPNFWLLAVSPPFYLLRHYFLLLLLLLLLRLSWPLSSLCFLTLSLSLVAAGQPSHLWPSY